MKTIEELGISPAPWKARMDFWIDDANGEFVFTDSCVTNLHGKNHANAPLIAAAPELYEALREMFELYTDGSGYERELKVAKKARAALAKAAGEAAE